MLLNGMLLKESVCVSEGGGGKEATSHRLNKCSLSLLLSP